MRTLFGTMIDNEGPSSLLAGDFKPFQVLRMGSSFPKEVGQMSGMMHYWMFNI